MELAAMAGLMIIVFGDFLCLLLWERKTGRDIGFLIGLIPLSGFWLLFVRRK